MTDSSCSKENVSSKGNNKTEIHERSKVWPQYLAVLTASLATWAVSINFAWTSPSIPIILETTNITETETSYIAMMQSIGDILGALISILLADRIGRKTGLLLINVPLIISWIIIAFSNNLTMFCIGRLISGTGEGLMYNFYPMYVGEVAEPKVRGVLGGVFSLAMCIGMLMINCIAPYFTIQTTAFICLGAPIITFISFFWMPESPYFYLMKGKTEQARQSLYFLRRYDVSKDLEQLDHDVKRQMSERGTFKDLVTIKSNRKALLIMIFIRTVQQWSAISSFITFTQSVFLKASPNMSPVVATALFYVTLIIVQIIGSLQVDKYGRKSLLILSSLLTGLILIAGAAFFYLQEKTDYDLSGVEWMPIAIMLIYVIVYGFGVGIIPMIMLGEMFSASIKGRAMFIMCIYYAASVACYVKLFHFLTQNGMFLPFFVFGICSLFSVIITYFFIPETKGKSLEDIQQYLKGNKKYQL